MDNELTKIADDHVDREQHIPDNIRIHDKKRSNIRRRSVEWNEKIDDTVLTHLKSASSYTKDHIWEDLIEHAWQSAESMHRSSAGSLIKISNDETETIPCPYLICTMELPGHKRHTTGSSEYENMITTFNKGYAESLLVKSAFNETCAVLTLTADEARLGSDNYKGDRSMIAMPLVDIMKIHSGTIDEVSSLGWSVPYVNSSQTEPSKLIVRSTNATEMLNEWERIIIVDFVPGLGGMKEEAQLLQVVNEMMNDIQDMGEVGWLGRLNEEERKGYVVDDALASVPAISEMFSLTATLNNNDQGEDKSTNNRVSFWREALQHGIESEHACSEMFTTLFVKPRDGYYAFDLILNPADGPPPSAYESSASNPACVTSLIAGLSCHREYMCCFHC
jgi:hypothetical protein